MSNVAVECHNIVKHYGTNCAVAGASFALQAGQFMALLGPSGCGKTTMLRLIAGLERPDQGDILLHGREVSSDKLFISAHQRNVGMVFQDYALFPHMTVAKNIAYGLSRSSDSQQQVAEMLELVGLTGFEDRYPAQLSGGQQQRVALARALAPHPHTLLLDEPFSNLDTALRVQVREDVQRIIAAAGVSAILVTHDQDEAMSMADQIGVMLNGEIVQSGTPREVYETPLSPEVMLFLGDANRLAGTAQGDTVETALGRLPLREAHHGAVGVFIRPEQFILNPDHNGVDVQVQRTKYYGNHQTVWATLPDGTALMIHAGADVAFAAGDTLPIAVRGAVLAFPEE